MLKIFYPYEYVERVFSIDYKKLYGKGDRGLIFDIDNTLVHHGEDSTREIDKLFKDVQKIGFKTLVLSNNSENSEKRIQKFLENIDSLYIHDAKKKNLQKLKKKKNCQILFQLTVPTS